MSIVKDGPCQLILRTGGEEREELFSRASKHWVLFRAPSMAGRNAGRQLGQASKRVCKLLRQGVLESESGQCCSSRGGDLGD